MIPHHFYYQLVVLGLLWLVVMLHLARAGPGVRSQTKLAKLIPPRRKRSTAPKLFAGLTQRPHCALCEQETGEIASPPPLRPDASPQRSAAPGPWTPRGTFIPIPSVTIAGGWG